jgi:DNA-binding FadR family transcriptional regulator
MTKRAFATVERQSLSDSVYRQLERKIVGRELAPGDELPAERELCEMLGVNRGAVREALKRLQQAGLIAIRQGGASRVLDFQSEGGLDLLPTLIVDSQGNLNPGVARSILGMRAAMAPDIASQAATKGGPKVADTLDAIVERMRRSQADVPLLQELALSYWKTLVDGGGGIAFRLAFNSMTRAYRLIWNLLTKVLEGEFRDLDNLQALADAVRARDANKARECAEAHVGIGSREMDRALKAYEKSQGSKA